MALYLLIYGQYGIIGPSDGEVEPTPDPQFRECKQDQFMLLPPDISEFMYENSLARVSECPVSFFRTQPSENMFLYRVLQPRPRRRCVMDCPSPNPQLGGYQKQPLDAVCQAIGPLASSVRSVAESWLLFL